MLSSGCVSFVLTRLALYHVGSSRACWLQRDCCSRATRLLLNCLTVCVIAAPTRLVVCVRVCVCTCMCVCVFLLHSLASLHHSLVCMFAPSFHNTVMCKMEHKFKTSSSFSRYRQSMKLRDRKTVHMQRWMEGCTKSKKEGECV